MMPMTIPICLHSLSQTRSPDSALGQPRAVFLLSADSHRAVETTATKPPGRPAPTPESAQAELAPWLPRLQSLGIEFASSINGVGEAEDQPPRDAGGRHASRPGCSAGW